MNFKSALISFLCGANIYSIAQAQQDEVDATKAVSQSQGHGVHASVFYDPLSNVNRLKFGSSEYDFESEEVTGLTGVALRYSYQPELIRYSIGLDIGIEKDIDAAGDAPLSWDSTTATQQSFRFLALRLFQLDYIKDIGPFQIIPGGGIGIMQGTNEVQLKSSRFDSTNTIAYMKVLGTLHGGAKVAYHVIPRLALFLGAELSYASKLGDNLDQSGDWSYYSLDEELKSSLDFMNGLGARTNLGINYNF